MIEKKSVINAIKRALQSGSLSLVGQDLCQFPSEILAIDTLNFQDQNWWQCYPISKIDLSNNQISIFPEGIAKLPDLQLIRMKNNSLKQLPESIFLLQNIKSLDFAKNKLQTIPHHIQNSRGLVELILSGNELSRIPDLHQLTALQILSIDSNKISELPRLSPNLKRLDASSNQIKLIPKANISQSRLLEYINLNKNQIQQVENGAFSNCGCLVSLEIKQNRLVSLTELPRSEKLDTLAASFNRLQQFQQFQRCPNLTVLVLGDNKLQKLSSGIIALKNLKTLDISNNDLSDLPSELGLLPALVRIQLQGNPLKCIRQNVRTAGAQILKKYLREKMDTTQLQQMEKKVMDPRHQMNSGMSEWDRLIMQFTTGAELAIRGQGLKDLDLRVYKPTIRTLNLSQNKLTTIHPQIIEMTQLQTLNLSENSIERLPNEVLLLQTLEQLDVRKNKIEDLFGDKNLCRLDRLFFLDFSVNKVNKMPPFLKKLRRLRILHFSYNKITSIEQLFDPNAYKALQVIDASNNQIPELSEAVWNRGATLNYLNVQNNNIAKLPTVIGFMRLTGLKVDGNPLKLIKRTVIDKGTVALMEDLRTRHQGPQPFLDPPPKMQVQTHPEPEIEKELPKKITQKNVTLSKQSEIPSKNKQQINKRIVQIGHQISDIERQIENNLSLNKIQKNEKKKMMQSLLIQRNKLAQML